LAGVAIHWEPVDAQTSRIVSLETRWIATSLAPLPTCNDNPTLLSSKSILYYRILSTSYASS
ncbi:hypothetical protein OAQ34_11555, partial [Opitutales bacterium]|nr:hypothetical protein [Opitutales bacterium]